MEQDRRMSFLVAYGRTMGLSIDDMEKISADIAATNNTIDSNIVSDVVIGVTGNSDPNVLWKGAAVYGFVLDACGE